MWTIQCQRLGDREGMLLSIEMRSCLLSVREVIELLETDAKFRAFFNASLANMTYDAFRWETPGVTAKSLDSTFECVVLDAPELLTVPNPYAFAEHFADAENGVAAIWNLGMNARLIVPTPVMSDTAYGHLAAFARLAPGNQQSALWRVVGLEMGRRIGIEPVWLNTAGAAVPWLHIRLDSRPKYYLYEPFKQVA